MSGARAPATGPGGACAECLRRSWLIAELAGHLGRAHERRAGPAGVLALSDADLIAALGGPRRASLLRAYEHFKAEPVRRACQAAGLESLCHHHPGYPGTLRGAPDAPSLLHVAGGAARVGDMLSGPAAAIVGARRASSYGLEVARALGRGLAAAGVTVVSGMALGVDSAAHAGALEVDGPTIAVLAGGADRPYPASKRGLFRRIVASGAVVSEMPPAFVAHPWCFPARNRTIAGLAALTIVVEAGARSGALITADLARGLGRDVAAVPGPVTCPTAEGTNALLFDGALMVRDAQDALDLLFGPGAREARSGPDRDALEPPLRELLEAVAGGRDTVAVLSAGGLATEEVMDGLAELELGGYVRRGPGGRYATVA